MRTGPPPTPFDDARARLVQTVWDARRQIAAAEYGKHPPLLVLVGHELWSELLKPQDIQDAGGPWSVRESGTLRVFDAVVHPVDEYLVPPHGWRIVRDLNLTGTMEGTY